MAEEFVGNSIGFKHVSDEKTIQYTWSPGNGTKYEIMVQKLPRGADFGCLGSVREGGWLVVCGLTRRSHMFASVGMLHENYVREKLGITFDEDLHYVTELIKMATGRL